MTSLKYQPHIDGLRAIAVLLVIFHHLHDLGGVTGGYVGVDVFFVISGYLITTIVKIELDAGRFTFGGFYRRRIVRLAPAYFAVLLATSVASFVWMLPAEFMQYARSMVASSLFLANVHMWKEVGGYFGAVADSAPLLHLWSLAVEEQFYLFWPVCLLLAHKFVPRRFMPWLLLLLVVCGAMVSQWGVVRYPAAAYYLLPTRVFELLLGAFVAYLPRPVHRAPVGAVLSFTGLGLIGYAAWAYSGDTLFPGVSAIAPVLGAALILNWGASGLVGRLLGLPVATFVGKLSYPAYLWHWPIIVFVRLNEVQMDFVVALAVLVTTFLLSWATWLWIEVPARRLLELPVRVVFVVGAGMPIAGSIAAALMVVSLEGLPDRFPESMNRRSEALLAFPSKERGRCNEGPPTAPLGPDECVLGRHGGPVDLLLVGDSHANHFSGFVDVLASDGGLRGYDMTRSNTPFLPGVDRWMMRGGEADHHENFVPRNEFVADLIKKNRYSIVVLAGNYTGFHGREILRAGGLEGRLAFERGMRDAIELARAASSRVVILTTVPILPPGLHDCTLRAERFGRELDCDFSARRYAEQIADVDRYFSDLKREYPDVVWVEIDEILCGSSRCVTELDGVPLYRDSGHLNDIGARVLARKWLERFGNPLVDKS